MDIGDHGFVDGGFEIGSATPAIYCNNFSARIISPLEFSHFPTLCLLWPSPPLLKHGSASTQICSPYLRDVARSTPILREITNFTEHPKYVFGVYSEERRK
jgi:hypothetical protein